MRMSKLSIVPVLLSLFLFACQNEQSKSQSEKLLISSSIVPQVVEIKEAFSTHRDEGDNVDSPAVWHGKDGQHWILATAKGGNTIIVYDAATGDKIKEFGKLGIELGEFSRPNGIAVIDDLAIVVERDNHRVQILSLPEMKPLASFGATELRSPYGVTVDKFDDKYNLYITDNYEMPDESTPPIDSLGQRVHYFTFTAENNQISSAHIKAFGATSEAGALRKVESILIDRAHNRLLIADEHEEQCNVKIYDVDGTFSGQIIPHNYFFYEPEGIAVWKHDDNKSGYYIIVDQGKINNTFQVFDRASLQYIGGFRGETVRNTDGIALTQKQFGDFKCGAFYPIHNDGSLVAISWEEIVKALTLEINCQ